MELREFRALLTLSLALGMELGCATRALDGDGDDEAGEEQGDSGEVDTNTGGTGSGSGESETTTEDTGSSESGATTETTTEASTETGVPCFEPIVEGFADPDDPEPCVFEFVDYPPSNVPYLSVSLDDVEVDHVEREGMACPAEEGWVWLIEGEQMSLCGAACEAFVNEGAYVEMLMGCPPEGRPALDAGRPRLPALVLGADGSLGDAAAQAWLRRARSEAASVPAFERLAAELEVLGAPARFVETARRGALEEREHARLALAEARRHGARGLSLGPVELPRRPEVDALTLLRETLVEACVAETLAAHHLSLCAARARDPRVRATWATVAAQERGHAAFAWALAAWLMTRCGAPGRALVRSLLAQPRFVLDDADTDDAGPPADGFASLDARRQAYAEAERELVRPSLAALLQRAPKARRHASAR
ncbi:hypothetical protein PPSIR1_03153 [Plesiocystis pacifica SIR-1]|uniref:Uncharacterized protein n=1 Tax=Plesiocystis pacifica SIR-1 TaxID=391625 RepID=A6GI25_9BACT|nr:hypothetical protein [Plesiocystis pacifica]EDM74488.1 hypothetical protein PPSIR1_03153 [Plesiocystis pacifica SIR-1]